MLGKFLGNCDLQTSAPFLVANRCLRNRYRASTCRQCADSCAEQAVCIKRTVIVDESRCSGCLACIAACPAEALVSACQRTQLFNGKILDSRADRIVVACTRNPSLRPDISVECLAVFSLHDLAALSLTVKNTEIHLEHCSQCPRSPAIKNLRASVSQVSRLILSSSVNKLLLIANTKAPSSQRAQRRTFLRFLKKTALQTVGKQFVAAETPLPAKKKNRHVPRRLQLLQQALRLAEKTAQVSAAKRLYPNLTFLRHCDRCGKCVASCPAGALGKNRVRGGAINFERFSCSGCGLCLEFCPTAAVSISSSLL